MLSHPGKSGELFEFTAEGPTNETLIVESSEDLRTWTARLTNVSTEVRRVITVSSTGAAAFWRGRSASRFTGAIMAKMVLLNGPGVLVDSFDSTDPTYSNEGRYDTGRRRDGARVWLGESNGAVHISGAKLAGSICTSPSAEVLVTANGSVGDLAWIASTMGGIQPGRLTRQDVVGWPAPVWLPFSGGRPIPGGAIGGTNYTYLLNGGNYRVVGALALDGTKTMLVTADSSLYVSGTMTIKDSGTLIVGPDARLNLYFGQQLYIQGMGQANSGGRAEQLGLFGLSTLAEVYLTDNSAVCGAVYTLQAKTGLSGSAQLMGAIAAREAVIQGNAQLHFDESLLRSSP